MKGDDGDQDKLIGFCEDLAEKISEVLDADRMFICYKIVAIKRCML